MRCSHCPLFESWSTESDSGANCGLFGDDWSNELQYEDKNGCVIGCYVEKCYIVKKAKEADARFEVELTNIACAASADCTACEYAYRDNGFNECAVDGVKPPKGEPTMSREKQIEEMAEQIKYMTGSYTSDAEDCATVLYEQMNYRKQSAGEWIKKEYDIDGEITVGIVCNICGASRVAGLGLAKYCYMCGAKMKGGAE